MKSLKKIFAKKIMAKCGHMTELKGEVGAFGESGTCKIPKNEDGTVNYCLKCIEKMTIRCAWCGLPIFIGQPVTLYTPKKNFKIPDYAVTYQKKPLQLVGCFRWDCADTGADRAGFWVPPGQVYRVMSPLEQCWAEVKAGGDGIIINNNLHDIEGTIPIK